jgi:hypothetical protein
MQCCREFDAKYELKLGCWGPVAGLYLRIYFIPVFTPHVINLLFMISVFKLIQSSVFTKLLIVPTSEMTELIKVILSILNVMGYKKIRSNRENRITL